LSASQFVDKVRELVPDSRETLDELVESDDQRLAVYVAADALGHAALAAFFEYESRRLDRWKALLAYAESAANDGESIVCDAIGLDFVPAMLADLDGRLLPRRLYDQIGPEMRRIIAAFNYPIQAAANFPKP
jgi:hypothetical protein